MLTGTRLPARRCALVLASVVSVGGCDGRATSADHATPETAARLIQTYGCGGCHTIPGVTGATGQVGPPLAGIGRRVFLAGVLRNEPPSMIRWLRNPQAVVPGNAMPDMGISEGDARIIAAYLATLR